MNKISNKNWEIKSLNDVSRKLSLNKLKIKQKEYLPSGSFPVIDQGQDLIGGYYNDESLLVSDEPPYIIFGDHTKVKKYIPFKFIPGADGVKVLKAKENILPKFLYYLLFTIKIEDKGYARHFQLLEKENFLIPNDFETQQAIVSKIEELFSELDKGIEDLKTAQQQLKTYRQSVLKWAFEGKLTNENVKDGKLPKGWELSTLKNLKQFSIYGPRFSSKDYSNSGIAVLRTTDISERGKVDWINSPKLDLTDLIFEKYKLIKGDLLITRTGSIGRLSIFNDTKKAIPGAFLIHYRLLETLNVWYIFHFLKSQIAQKHFSEYSFGVGRPNLNVPNIELLQIPIAPIEEQHRIVQEIESRLSVADKMEESIAHSLLQAESLRQSILKKAFSGELVKEAVPQKVYKPKSAYFFQMQLIGKIAAISKKNKIEHGEMTIAKYAYLSDKIYGIPTGFQYDRWHLGPYPPAIKKVINNKHYFQRISNHIEVVNEETLFKSTNDYTTLIEDSISSLVTIFSKYKTPAERAHKTELLATVCKVIEDIETTDLKLVRASMKEWKIILKTSSFKNKAEKFNEEETKNCIEFIVRNGWDKKLIGFKRD